MWARARAASGSEEIINRTAYDDGRRNGGYCLVEKLYKGDK